MNTILTEREKSQGWVLDRNGRKRIKTQIWSRVVGYLRPTEYWNEGKKEEFKERKVYSGKIPTKVSEVSKKV